jgi:hypothetical protein
LIPKEYTILLPDPFQQGSLGNSGVEPHRSESPGQRTARSPQRAKRTASAAVERFWLLNRWQGQVLSVGRESFEAQLFDPAHPSVIEHAEFSISELSPDGLALLRPGAIFYWMIGYRDFGSRQRMREPVIWMRRSGRMGHDKFQSTLDHVEAIWTDLTGQGTVPVVERKERRREALTDLGQSTVLLVEDEERRRALNVRGLEAAPGARSDFVKVRHWSTTQGLVMRSPSSRHLTSMKGNHDGITLRPP